MATGIDPWTLIRDPHMCGYYAPDGSLESIELLEDWPEWEATKLSYLMAMRPEYVQCDEGGYTVRVDRAPGATTARYDFVDVRDGLFLARLATAKD